jgi:recombination protein RecA
VLQRLRVGRIEPSAELAAEWTLPALTGRLVEMSGDRASASLSLAFSLVLDAQRRGEHCAWIGTGSSSFFPPDVAELGVDLDALVVVRVARGEEIAVAADWLLRPGAFGLVVLDLTTSEKQEISMGGQSRLVSLAQKHTAAVLCLTDKPAVQRSLSSLVSLRVEASLVRRGTDLFECELRVLKDKQRPATWRHVEVRRGTPGLR